LKTIYLAVGDELVDGRISDTNSRLVTEALGSWISRLCNLQVPDSVSSIQAALNWARSQHAKLIIVSGGLGPTRDDLTRDAVAAVSGSSLEWNEDAWEIVVRAFSVRGIKEIPEVNKQQAMLPKGAVILNNDLGTAPGFAIRLELGLEAPLVICLPGVPYEFEAMLNHAVMPFLRKQGIIGEAKLIEEISDQFLFAGIGESAFEAALQDLIPRESISSYSICARDGLLELKVGWRLPADRDQHLPALRNIVAPYFISDSVEKLSLQVMHAIAAQQTTLAVIESATGGTLAMVLAAAQSSSTGSVAATAAQLLETPFGNFLGASLLGFTAETETIETALLSPENQSLSGTKRSIQTCEHLTKQLMDFRAAESILINIGKHPVSLPWQGESTEVHSIVLSKTPRPSRLVELETQKMFKGPMTGIDIDAANSKILAELGYRSLITWSNSVRVGPASQVLRPVLAADICRRMTNWSLAGMLKYLQIGRKP
jgi:nicotinamide-nucleotide amidase